MTVGKKYIFLISKVFEGCEKLMARFMATLQQGIGKPSKGWYQPRHHIVFANSITPLILLSGGKGERNSTL